ncbi:hypothetical protein [Paenibacillus sp. 1P07SE]
MHGKAAEPVTVPLKYPHYNASNYRGEFNYPADGSLPKGGAVEELK